MEEWLLARGYSEIVVNNQIDKVVFGRDQSVKKNLESGIPFITTYHPKVKKVFSPPPIVSREIKIFYSEI